MNLRSFSLNLLRQNKWTSTAGKNDAASEEEYGLIVATSSSSSDEKADSRSDSTSHETSQSPQREGSILKCKTLLDSLEGELVSSSRSRRRRNRTTTTGSTTTSNWKSNIEGVSFGPVTVHYHSYTLAQADYDFVEGPPLALGHWTESEIFEDLDQYEDEGGNGDHRRDDDLFMRPSMRRYLLLQEWAFGNVELEDYATTALERPLDTSVSLAKPDMVEREISC